MAIPSGYSRSTFYGTLPGGDIFNFSLWANEAPADQAATQAQADAFATEFKVSPGTNVSAWQICSTTTTFSGVRVYSYLDTTGKATHIADSAIGQAGTASSGSTLPNQCCVVVTLKSAVAGRRSQGRIYLPCTNQALSSPPALSTAIVTGLANWMADLIHRLNSHIGSQKIGVLSQVGATFQPFTTVKVDSKIDIQRRRANKGVISYTYSTPIS